MDTNYLFSSSPHFIAQSKLTRSTSIRCSLVHYVLYVLHYSPGPGVLTSNATQNSRFSMYSMFSTVLYSANFTPCCSTGSWLYITLIGYFVDRLLVYHKFPQFYHLEMQVVHGDLLLSLVRPHLEYGCLVWDPHLVKDIIKSI